MAILEHCFISIHSFPWFIRSNHQPNISDYYKCFFANISNTSYSMYRIVSEKKLKFVRHLIGHISCFHSLIHMMSLIVPKKIVKSINIAYIKFHRKAQFEEIFNTLIIPTKWKFFITGEEKKTMFIII